VRLDQFDPVAEGIIDTAPLAALESRLAYFGRQ
jgi:hypothetical protein